MVKVGDPVCFVPALAQALFKTPGENPLDIDETFNAVPDLVK